MQQCYLGVVGSLTIVLLHYKFTAEFTLRIFTVRQLC